MEAVFLKLVNMSITTSWLVLAVMVLRLLLKKVPKAIIVIMWAFVGVRLICPFSFESVLSLIPSAETIPEDIVYSDMPRIQSGVTVLNSTVNPMISGPLAPAVGDSVNPVQVVLFATVVVWIVGMATMLLYTAVSYLCIYRKIREAILLTDNIWLCDRIFTPFVLGLIRPRIYLPSDMDQGDMEYVIAHEKAHLRRRDHWWKPLGFLLLTVYWFNPILWLAYFLFCRDIELACDEKVIKNMGAESKKPYSEALINCSAPRKRIAACPLAFAEGGVKRRIKAVLNYRKPAFWLIIVAVVICAALAVGFLTNPASNLDDDLKTLIDCRITDHHQSVNMEQYVCCLDWEVLGTESNFFTTTVYMWALYEEYSNVNGLKLENSAHVPVVITVKKESGHYSLVEYWEPGDGSDYADDIRNKFPWYLQRKALDPQRYIDKQRERCEKMAEEYPNPVLISRLKEAYPQYFGLPTENGLTVYVWQMAQGSYSCGLLHGKRSNYQEGELPRLFHPEGELLILHHMEEEMQMLLHPAGIDKMKMIVQSYHIPKSEVVVCPIRNPLSSYYYEINPAYRKWVERLFWVE